ncbi:YHS domain-containing (seleno)protein [Tenacibaculum sp. M341]|uniref:YHS domain-containing (seleno)protein n=1 Tax=Tenacibaculum sp. M341 TaxID=2530339 RepID=UPI001044D65A|nr:YHS domain-containing (seleno)protein [Tenacibaculum sp. M341]TCI92096.1 YHS domain-containing protein [Tenacibaculum sp. M341]
MKKLTIYLLTIVSFAIFSSCTSNSDEKLAVSGYDVISYFNETKPVKGNETISTDYNGRTFHFANKESLNEFLKNPDKYVPQYGGYCAYAVAKKKIKMDVNPEVYEIRDGKLYLFYNAWFSNKLNDWQEEDTKALQKQGDINWAEMKKESN